MRAVIETSGLQFLKKTDSNKIQDKTVKKMLNFYHLSLDIQEISHKTREQGNKRCKSNQLSHNLRHLDLLVNQSVKPSNKVGENSSTQSRHNNNTLNQREMNPEVQLIRFICLDLSSIINQYKVNAVSLSISYLRRAFVEEIKSHSILSFSNDFHLMLFLLLLVRNHRTS